MTTNLPDGREVIRLLTLFDERLNLSLKAARPKARRLTLTTTGTGYTIQPGYPEYEIVLNNTVYIGFENGEHVVYTVKELPGDRDTPPDADMVEQGRFKYAWQAARRAVLVWAEVLVDGVLESDQERRLDEELAAVEKLMKPELPVEEADIEDQVEEDDGYEDDQVEVDPDVEVSDDY